MIGKTIIQRAADNFKFLLITNFKLLNRAPVFVIVMIAQLNLSYGGEKCENQLALSSRFSGSSIMLPLQFFSYKRPPSDPQLLSRISGYAKLKVLSVPQNWKTQTKERDGHQFPLHYAVVEVEIIEQNFKLYNSQTKSYDAVEVFQLGEVRQIGIISEPYNYPAYIDVGSFVSAGISFDTLTADNKWLMAMPSREFDEFPTVDDFFKIKDYERSDLIVYLAEDYKSLQNKEYKTRELKVPDSLFGTDIGRRVQKMIDEVAKEMNFEAEDNGYSVVKIGKPYFTWNILTHVSGQLLGIHLSVTQFGGQMPEELEDGVEIPGYFETNQEAKAAGIDTEADVSWSNKVTVEIDPKTDQFNILYQGDYMEWSGY